MENPKEPEKRIMKKFLSIMLVACLAGTVFAFNVGVWNPGTGTDVPANRFNLRQAELDNVSQWLKEAGMNVVRVNENGFNGDFEVLFMGGECFPKAAKGDIKAFAERGGVVVTLEGLVPLLVEIDRKDSSSKWELSPKSPKFAWQNSELLYFYGFRYYWKPEYHDQGTIHEPTELLKKYLKSAEPIDGSLAGRWLPSVHGGKMIPLVFSRRFDDVVVIPQIFIAERGNVKAIFCTNIDLVNKDMVVGLAQLANDISKGLELPEGITIPDEIPLPEPLRLRGTTAGVDPDGVKPIKRWGRFDGCSNELGKELPRGLKPGESLELTSFSSKSDKSPVFLRIRGAYNEDGAGLKVQVGDDVVWNETLTFIDAQGESNFGVIEGGEPIEFNRIIFVPSCSGKLTISNPGKVPFYFDAVQLEERDFGPDVYVGVGIADWPGFPVEPEESQQWPCVRAPLRMQLVGDPSDETRWQNMDKLIKRYADENKNIHGILQNTPEWAAIDEEHLAAASASYRARDVAPDPDKYVEMVTEFIGRYGDVVEGYELWNEPNLKKFYWGTVDEFVELFAKLAPAVRKAKPDAKIIGPGFAGHTFKEYLTKMAAHKDAMDCVDWMAIHCYCGKGPAWDRIGYGYEGDLFALGINKPLYANEQGFVFRNAQWFKAPPVYTEHLQGINTSIGMARLMAGGLCKVNIFIVGPGNHEFDIVRADGTPRPAYKVVKDYMQLARKGSTRLDVSMCGQDGKPVAGIYVAAAEHKDNSLTIVVNPAEIKRMHPKPEVFNPSDEFNKDGAVRGHSWFGSRDVKDGVLELKKSEGKDYVGMEFPATVDLNRWPLMEISIKETDKPISLNHTYDGKEVVMSKSVGVGVHKFDFRKLISSPGNVFEGALKIRVPGDAKIDYIRFTGDEPGTVVIKNKPIEPEIVKLRFPLPEKASYTTDHGKFTNHGTWGELELAVRDRTVVSITKDGKNMQ